MDDLLEEAKREQRRELERLAADLGKTPTTTDVREQAKFSYQPYHSEFENFDDALAEADLERLGDVFGRAPTQPEIRDYGKHSHMAYYRHFEDLPTALERAGFKLDDSSLEWLDDYPADWVRRAERVRERDGYECATPDCGMTNDEYREEYDECLHVHHVATDDDPDTLENLATLCKPCHVKWDRVKADPRDCE